MKEERPVVSDSGPLMVLAKLNGLYLLQILYGRIRIPSTVYAEAVTMGQQQGYQDARTLCLFLNQMGWEPEEVDPADVPASLWKARIDRGERDALALAFKLRDALLLMDEVAGRSLARSQGVAVRGSLGVLIEAYRRQLLPESQLRLCFAEIARRQDIWISPTVVERLLREVLG